MALHCPQMVTMHNYNLVSITIVFAFMLIVNGFQDCNYGHDI